MFGRNRPRKNRNAESPETRAPRETTTPGADGSLVAAITAAIAAFLATEPRDGAPHPGFVVRRVRRVSGLRRTREGG